jgi:DNA repair protein SbcC/Rad50
VRLHRLEVEAFGPFATRQIIDFDDLSDAGLFLLHGATGAGKTSILDAICYALFGQVPGARREGRPRLRSDHAPPGVAPRVVLEVTVGGRRLEVTRTPEWQRPKKRGAGTTREPASTDVRERIDGTWVVRVGRRSDEAGLLLGEVLGMGLEQFTKVVLLPQGEFAAFLRAGAEQRADLLSRLFDIDRYAGVEAWLRDERQRLSRLVSEADAGRDALIARAHQAATPVIGSPGGATVDAVDELALATPPGPELVAALAATARTALETAERVRDQARSAAEDATGRLRTAESLAQRLDRHQQLVDALRALDTTAQAHRLEAERLEAAQRAERLTLVIGRLDAAERAQVAASDALTQALTEARPVLGDVIDGLLGNHDAAGLLEQLLDERRRELARLDEARSLAEEVAALDAQLVRTTQALADAVGEVEAASTALADAQTAADTAQAAVEQLVQRAVGLDAAELARASAESVHRAALDLVACDGELADCRDARFETRDAEQAAHGRLLDLRERRLLGMAGELAAQLADDEPCPVCGSCEHPQPARADGDHVDEQAERRARSAHEKARAAHLAAEAAFADVSARHAALVTGAAGLEVPAAAERVRVSVEQVQLARQAAADLIEVRAEVERQRAAVQAAGQRLAAARHQHGQLEAALAHLAPHCGELRDRLAALVGEAPDLATARQTVAAQLQAAQRVAADLRSAGAAAAQHSELLGPVEAVARELGFADVAAARDASLDAAALASLERTVRDRDRARADAQAVLATPEMASLTGVDRPDVDAARTAAEAALDAARHSERVLAVTLGAHTALEDLAQQLREHDDVHRELRRRFRDVDVLSRCVEGTGGGNARRMRLSAFVLAARLEQVAAAASERLLAMSDGRFTLVHTDSLVKGGGRSGLGLQVVDGWTGVARETATLSGGESFLASLALALGLADVVQAEAGGTAIETLFVDEGFGTLDDDTLEEVMGVLDALRDGGRAVGIVSHVADLRSRIPARLEVVKSRTGSSVRQREPLESSRRAAG